MEGDIIVFRMAERLVLSGLILCVAIVVMVGFWRSLQRIDFQVTREQIGAGGSTVLVTPVFVLLALIGYAWVSLSNPITVAAPVPPPSPAAENEADPQDGEGSLIILSTGREVARDDPQARARVVDIVRSLNCYAALVSDPSARLEDDLIDAKLVLLGQVWAPEWGEPEVLADWATGRSEVPPDRLIEAIWREEHPLC